MSKLRGLLPHTYWSTYDRLTGEPGRVLVIWRQWGRKVWDCTEVRVG